MRKRGDSGDKVKIDNLTDEIMNGLKEYADLATDDLKKSVRKAGNTVRKRYRCIRPKGYRSLCEELVSQENEGNCKFT